MLAPAPGRELHDSRGTTPLDASGPCAGRPARRKRPLVRQVTDATDPI